MIPRAFRDATAPSPDAIARLERCFSGRSTRTRLALLPQPGPAPTLAPSLSTVAFARPSVVQLRSMLSTVSEVAQPSVSASV